MADATEAAAPQEPGLFSKALNTLGGRGSALEKENVGVWHMFFYVVFAIWIVLMIAGLIAGSSTKGVTAFQGMSHYLREGTLPAIAVSLICTIIGMFLLGKTAGNWVFIIFGSLSSVFLLVVYIVNAAEGALYIKEDANSDSSA